MGLDAVVEEIRENGRREAEGIQKEARDEVGRILVLAQEKAATIKLAVEDELKRQSAHILSQEVSAAHLVAKREVLNAQKNLLDEVYQNALIEISRLPESFHREAIQKLLVRAKADIPEGVVHCNARDMLILRDVLIKDPALKSYHPGRVVESEGGIIVASNDGELTLDLSYRTYLDALWESGLRDAAEILFG
ncbi:MAG: V-type ATP synthase subunit E family protein [Methanomicrobiales archaeon]|nr:V-type ATP synthase subunit E family protein [Methanomicrobiales archaeon]